MAVVAQPRLSAFEASNAADSGIRLFGRTIEATTSQGDAPRASVSAGARHAACGINRTEDGEEDDITETAGSPAVSSADSQRQCGLDAILAAAMEGQTPAAQNASAVEFKKRSDQEPESDGDDDSGMDEQLEQGQAQPQTTQCRTEQQTAKKAAQELSQPSQQSQQTQQESQQEPEQQQQQQEQSQSLKRPTKKVPCPRCASMDTKFCYYNNYNASQPRHFCKACQRYWTAGGTLRNVPVGSGRRKGKAACSGSASAVSAPAGSAGAQLPAVSAAAGPFGFCSAMIGRSASMDGGSVTGLAGFTGMGSPGAEVLNPSSAAVAAGSAAVAAAAGASRWGMDSAVLTADGGFNFPNPMSGSGLQCGQFMPPNLPTHLPFHLSPNMAVDAAGGLRQMGLSSAFSAPTGANSALGGAVPTLPCGAPGAQAPAPAGPSGQPFPFFPVELPAGMVGNPAGLAALYPWRFGAAAPEAPRSLPGLPNLASYPCSLGGASATSDSAQPEQPSPTSAGPSAHAPNLVPAPTPSPWSPYTGAYPPAPGVLPPMTVQHPGASSPFIPPFNMPAFAPGALGPWTFPSAPGPQFTLPLFPAQLPHHPPMDFSRPGAHSPWSALPPHLPTPVSAAAATAVANRVPSAAAPASVGGSALQWQVAGSEAGSAAAGPGAAGGSQDGEQQAGGVGSKRGLNVEASGSRSDGAVVQLVSKRQREC